MKYEFLTNLFGFKKFRDYIIEDKYILTKPVPAEELTGEEYDESYMINPDLKFS